jgi:thymidylate kinase
MKTCIVFLGTDGSGKSTIIDAVIPAIKEKYNISVQYEHLRPNYIPSLAVLLGKRTKEKEAAITKVEDPHSEKPSGFLGSLFRLSYYFLDYTWGYYRKIYKSSGIWIFDRYYYDYMLDPRRGRINLPQWIIRFYVLFIPSPDLIFCLGTDAEKIHKRKPELPLNEVKRQISALYEFSTNYKNAVWIDTGCSIEESVNNTMSVINSYLNAKSL